MESSFQSEPRAPSLEKRRSPIVLIALAAGIVVLLAVAYFLLSKPPAPNAVPADAKSLTPGSLEYAYASSLRLENFAMKQSENYLNQEIKILEGDVTNAGSQTVLAIDGTIEFRDSLDQVALRETRPLVPPPGIEPGQTAHFELSFDHVPNSWNYQMPVVIVTGLKLSYTKR